MLPVVNKLKEAREELGLSQEEVARIFREKYHYRQVARQQVSLWEHGTVPKLEYALVLSDIYKKSIHELFRLE